MYGYWFRFKLINNFFLNIRISSIELELYVYKYKYYTSLTIKYALWNIISCLFLTHFCYIFKNMLIRNISYREKNVPKSDNNFNILI